MSSRYRILAAGYLLIAVAAFAAPPSGFRGSGSGAFDPELSATAWTRTSNVLWRCELPSWSNSSPVPYGDRVYTCAEPFVLLCVDAADGRILWKATNTYSETLSPEQHQQYLAESKVSSEQTRQRKALSNKLSAAIKAIDKARNARELAAQASSIETVTAQLKQLAADWKPTPLANRFSLPRCHKNTGYSTPTPVTDGKHVWALFGNGVAACFTRDGKRVWTVFIENPSSGHGHASSPRLVGDKLIVPINSLYALDPATGDTAWKIAGRARWGTPTPLVVAGEDALLCPDGRLVRVKDGKPLRSGLPALAYNCPVVDAGNRLVLVTDNAAYAFGDPAAGDDEASRAPQLWKQALPKGRMYASPVAAGDLVFGINQGSVLFVLDGGSGRKLLERNLGIRGPCYSSLTLAGQHLLAASESGEVVVLTADREAREISRNRLEGLRSSPAVDRGRLYLRTLKALYCIGR